MINMGNDKEFMPSIQSIRMRRFLAKAKWYLITTPIWFLFQKGNWYCPTCQNKLKEHYCKKCDRYFWRGNSH